MRELLMDTKTVEGEEKALRCRYMVLVGEKQVGNFACEAYGVKVVDEETGESAAIPDLTVSAQRIDQLMEQLVKGGVTPTGLADVVADWL